MDIISPAQQPLGPFALSVRALQFYKPEFIKHLIADVSSIGGFLCNFQIPIMFDMAGKMRGSFVEVGAWKGRTSVAILLGADLARFHLTVVDTFLGSEEHQAELQGKSTRGEFEYNINQRGFQESVTIVQKPSVEAAKDYDDESFDGAFIDAAHDYESIKSDILAWYPKLKRGAPMLFHDYPQCLSNGEHDPATGFPELFRVLNEYVRDTTDKFEGWGYCAGLAGAYKKQ